MIPTFAPVRPRVPRSLAGFAALVLAAIAASSQALTLDAFDPRVDGPDAGVWAIAEQADGRLLIGGDFTVVDGRPRRNLARLLADGRLDESFQADADDGVRAIAVQPDGRILVGGWFGQIGGQPRARLARLNADGSLDAPFDPGVTGRWLSVVCAIALQADGRLLVGGTFDEIGGIARTNLARLHANGVPDVAFSAPQTDATVWALHPLPDGRLLVGGAFGTVAGQASSGIARLQANGALDASFAMARIERPSPLYPPAVVAIHRQADGHLLVGGRYYGVEDPDAVQGFLVRLGPDGAIDADFQPGIRRYVTAIAAQPDGRLLVGGDFDEVLGTPRAGLARLEADLTLDASFDLPVEGGSASGAYLRVMGPIVNAADGSVLLGGRFTSVAGLPRGRAARFRDVADPVFADGFD